MAEENAQNRIKLLINVIMGRIGNSNVIKKCLCCYYQTNNKNATAALCSGHTKYLKKKAPTNLYRLNFSKISNTFLRYGFVSILPMKQYNEM